MMTTGPRILVVDDEPNMCAALLRILESNGYEVTTAPDGKTALELIETEMPDVILLDIMMPGISGRDVCQRVREISTAARVVYFTAKVEPSGPMELGQLKREADAFIAKPATSKQILAKVGSVL